jgi:hypothetical protein
VVWEFLDGGKIGERETREREERERAQARERDTSWLRDWRLPTFEDFGINL